ncbi:MAG: DUF2188 domain-containing protein [Verrucomicrobia bacterium]|nr:DUF2188 domain-containing protein [Verrucomicrobiota bacterium]
MATKTAPSGKFHVISRSGQWAVTRQGASRASRVVDSREGAVVAAKRMASGKTEIVVHRTDGTVSKRIGVNTGCSRMSQLDMAGSPCQLSPGRKLMIQVLKHDYGKSRVSLLKIRAAVRAVRAAKATKVVAKKGVRKAPVPKADKPV